MKKKWELVRFHFYVYMRVLYMGTHMVDSCQPERYNHRTLLHSPNMIWAIVIHRQKSEISPADNSIEDH
jgi:hypothetical protein